MLWLLASAPRAGAQCQMIFNVSVYDDAALSEDVTMAYHFSTTSDNSTLCTCGHGSYQTLTTVYAPDGAQSTVVSSGFASYVTVPINGRMGTWTVTGNASLFCSCAGVVDAGGVAAAITVAPTVAIQVEPGKRQGSNGLVLTGDTTALTATGYPGGGTYAWQLGPKLSLAGSASSPNTAVQGAEESSSIGDTWVRVSYTAGGQTAVASVRFTVRETRRLEANSNGGPSVTVPAPSGYGYVTWITYSFQDQFGETIRLSGMAATEILNTVSAHPPAFFYPELPDNTPKTDVSNGMGMVLDRLSAISTQPVPSDFMVIRSQRWFLRESLL